MSAHLHLVLKRPIITEKSNRLRETVNQYAFEVAMDANKLEVRQAVETIFGVRVESVRTQIIRGDRKRYRRGWGKKPNWKKAVVTLPEGQTIDVFEGV